MNKRIWPGRLPGYAGIFLFVVLAVYFIWDGMNGRGLWGIFAGIGLLVVAGATIFLKRLETQAETKTVQRIRTEYSPESQPQVFEIYQHMKIKELEGLFLKILDDAKGDITEVKKLAGIAESVGWKAFLENKW